MGAKGGNLFRLRAKHLSFILTVLVGTTILLWAWENAPLVASFLSSQDQFVMSSPEVLMGTLSPMDPLLSSDPEVHTEQNYLNSFETDPEVRTAQNYSNSSETDPEVHTEQNYSNSFETTETRRDQTEESLNLTTETRRDQTKKSFNLAPQKNFPTFSNESREDDSEPYAEIEDCNYAKGKWVADSRRPLYSGFGCKQWLSEMWACRLTQRPNFSYEGFKWQPKGCRMPEFERSKFFRRMRDKTLAFVGDSLARQQFQSLMCMVTGGEAIPDVHNIGRQYGLVKARGAIRPDGWAFRFPRSNTTILYYWSATLCDLEPINATDPKTDVAMHLDRPPAFLRTYLHTFDVLVLNTGHHWNRGKLVGNRWVMYVDGMPLVDKKLAPMANAKNYTVHSVVKWLDLQFLHYPRLKAFFRTISPRHFANGDWNTGGTCDNTSPLAGGSEVSQDESNDPVIASAVKGSKVKLLDITAISQLRDEGHISRYTLRPVQGMQDCLHWCLPGIPDTWNEILCAQI